MIGIAISTTGDEHRLGFLETCLDHWYEHAGPDAFIVVTVDGDEDACDRVVKHLRGWQAIYQVGQGRPSREGHQGVAVNKNTGLELLMKECVEHLFLCDDDTWPLVTAGITEHVRLAQDHGVLHNMICWGQGRHPRQFTNYASWSWPRGVLLYTHALVVDQVGGMDERFGPGGHEHVEWSKRIHNVGFTPKQFCSPRLYADDQGMGVKRLWHCSDIERRHKSTVRRVGKDWAHINQIMAERIGDTSFVPYIATENGRSSATLWSHLSDDRGVVQAKEPGSE